MTEVSIYLLLLFREVPKAEVSKITSYPQGPVHFIPLAFLFYLGVDELVGDGWGEVRKQVDFSTVRKFVAIQTAFHCSQQSLISLHHGEIWSQMCLSHMGVALSTWVYFASQPTLVYFAVLLLSTLCNPVNPSCSLKLCLGSVKQPFLHQGKARSNLSA